MEKLLRFGDEEAINYRKQFEKENETKELKKKSKTSIVSFREIIEEEYQVRCPECNKMQYINSVEDLEEDDCALCRDCNKWFKLIF